MRVQVTGHITRVVINVARLFAIPGSVSPTELAPFAVAIGEDAADFGWPFVEYGGFLRFGCLLAGGSALCLFGRGLVGGVLSACAFSLCSCSLRTRCSFYSVSLVRIVQNKYWRMRNLREAFPLVLRPFSLGAEAWRLVARVFEGIVRKGLDDLCRRRK